MNAMDDICDLIQDTSESLALYDVEAVTPEAARLAEISVKCTERVKDVVELLGRHEDKFEAIVRQTLHNVYGTVADTLLAAVPAGSLVAPNELVTTLPSRGVRLTSADGARIQLWPETRPGRDGPLVVAYRTVVEH